MGWLISFIRAIFGIEESSEHRSIEQKAEVISQHSKISERKNSNPKRELIKSEKLTDPDNIPVTSDRIVARNSKVSNRHSAKTRPNNPQTQALLDRVTGTLDIK